jgi:DNA polymerase-1
MLVFDTETNALLRLATQMWCVVAWDADTGELFYYYDGPDLVGWGNRSGTVREGVIHLSEYRQGPLVGHYISGFDIPVMKKLFPDITATWPALLSAFRPGAHEEDAPFIIDTLAMAEMLYPQQQAHGLDTWGKRLKREKPEHNDWTQVSAEMLHRCKEDVAINVALYDHLEKRKETLNSRTPDIHFNWNNSLDIEQKVNQIHAPQEVTGVRYDVLKAIKLKDELDVKATGLANYIIPRAPQHVINLNTGTPSKDPLAPLIDQGKTTYVHKIYKANGDFTKQIVDHFASEKLAKIWNIQGPFSRIDFDKLNLDSDVQVKNFLLSLGWKPTEWNVSKKTKKRTSPKLTEDSYGSIPPGLGAKIAEYNIVTHRRTMVLNRKGDEKGGLWAVKHRGDGRVSAQAFTCGTPTARYRHKGVVCNIPRPSSPYGGEIRETFCVPDQWWMLGLDLKGIEIRVMAHFAFLYNRGQEFMDIVMKGDFHANNGQLWDVTRDDSKPGLYGLCYGAMAPRLAQILNKPAHIATALFDAFWNAYPALKYLLDGLEANYKANRCIHGLDGRRVDVRDKRKLLNTLVQFASAIIFKEWMILNQLSIVANSWEKMVMQIIAYHDEIQYEVRHPEELAAIHVGEVFKKNALIIGEKYKINVPIEADAKIGKNWRDCH